MSAHTGDVGHPAEAPQLNEGSSGLERAPRAVVGYRVRVDGTGRSTYAYHDITAGGGWDPTDPDGPKPAPIARQFAIDLLRLCRAWSELVKDGQWTYRLVRVVRRG